MSSVNEIQGSKDTDFESLVKLWENEQVRVASLVEVYDSDESLYHPQLQLEDEGNAIKIAIDEVEAESPIYFGGVDVSFPEAEGDLAVAVYVVIEQGTMRIVYQDHEFFPLEVPYVPSFLAFREIEPLERLVRKQLSVKPNLTPKAILVDGNGVLHPRRAGIACFVGTRTGIPTIGVGKTLFCEGGLTKEGVLESIEKALHLFTHSITQPQNTELKSKLEQEKQNSQQKCSLVVVDPTVANDTCTGYKQDEHRKEGKTFADRGTMAKLASQVCNGVAIPLTAASGPTLAWALVAHGGRVAGSHSCGSKNPIYVSVGHKLSLLESARICAFLSIARIPEPVRQADLIGRELIRVKERTKHN